MLLLVTIMAPRRHVALLLPLLMAILLYKVTTARVAVTSVFCDTISAVATGLGDHRLVGATDGACAFGNFAERSYPQTVVTDPAIRLGFWHGIAAPRTFNHWYHLC